jgi:hypothetical protein
MNNELKCPNCGHQIDVENVLSAEIENKFQQQYQQKLQQSLLEVDRDKQKLLEAQQVFEEAKKRENEKFMQRVQVERARIEAELQASINKSVSEEFENKIKLLEQSKIDSEEKLKEARLKELEFLKKAQELKDKEAELELTLQKKLQEEREQLSEAIRRQEQEKNQFKETELQLKIKEVQLQLEEQKKLAEEMKRRAEQGSMQRQGEVQELLLEEILQSQFPFDTIEEVGKGVEGADCIQIVNNQLGVACGKIIYESKRTKAWQNVWVDKLKADMRNKQADVAILVTQVFPKEMQHFGEREGIWVCNFSEVAAVSHILRNGIIKVSEIAKSQENKGDKMQLLYNYLTGNEFRGQMEAIMEGFMALKMSIVKERVQMEKLWKEREKQLEKVLLNTSGMFGSVKGIAGASIADIPLLELGNEEDAGEN